MFSRKDTKRNTSATQRLQLSVLTNAKCLLRENRDNAAGLRNLMPGVILVYFTDLGLYGLPTRAQLENACIEMECARASLPYTVVMEEYTGGPMLEGFTMTFDDLPSVTYSDGTQEWYQGGVLHRDNGPAIVRPGISLWFQYGNYVKSESTGGCVVL